MSKEIYISSTPHETRLAIVEDDNLAEIYYERENEYTLAGSIYNGRVTRVLPGMQSSFVDIGLERDAFLYITDFMEEAGDSADFEAAHGGGDLRGSRSEPARSDAQKRDRPDRGERPAPLTLEGNAAPSAEPTNEARSDRGERNGRGRNRRGRGDRNGTPNRAPNSEAPTFTEEIAAPTAPSVPSDTAQLGEGAPGADGSRRWRGRRGRRRGRSGNGQPVEAQREEVTPGVSNEPEFVDYAVEVADSEVSEEDSEVFQSAPAAAAAAEPYTGEDEPSRSAPPREDSGNGQRLEGARRDGGRGGRNDRGGRNGRNDRNDRNDRGPRAPRGFAPSLNLYGVDASSGEGSEAPAEPIILPGESLSKYRRGSEAEAAQASAPAASANVILAKPTTVVDDFVATSWDGGAVLPGETLSRRNRPDNRQESRREPRAQYRSDSQQNFRAPAPVEAAKFTEQSGDLSIAATTEEHPEAAHVEHLDQPLSSETVHEAASPFAAEVPAPLDPIAAIPEPAAPPFEDQPEYEPEEAFASYRVDPAAPSEFRQSAPVLDEPVEASVSETEEAVVHVDHSHPFNRLDEADTEIAPAEPVYESAPHAHSETVSPVEHHEPLQHLDTTGVPPPPPVFSQTDSASAESDITAISPTGEMLSEPVNFAETQASEHDLTSPLHHESAVIASETHAYHPQSFAPGTGQLEEELIEDEEHEPASMHAAHDEEFEDLEEETLEGAADLGTMIREMSIDDITRPTDAESEDEDDDFEEEEAEYAHSAQNEAEELDDEGFVEGDKPAPQSAADAEFFADTFREPNTETSSEERANTERRPRRDSGRSGRSDGRRDGRERDRNRSRSTGGESDRGRSGGRSRSMQATNLPAISDLLKPGQELLIQIAKEPIAKKGARITSHIALPGRFLVFMPTVNHTGVSRKIESDSERRRLKEILLSEKGEASGGFIVRTAASGASEEELRSDLRFLLNLWADIKSRSESSKSPALIYHDLNLVERILRDQVTDTFSAIWVDTESEYERVLRFLQRFQPSLIRRVKLYTKEVPLFEQFGITEEINKALRSKVWLKSGGSIVINQTEALVAIDINTGKFVGKTARLEDTIVKTNLDAIPEIVRQIRLRDLGGIIIIDFIDMDERKNRNRVMAALEDELKNDRAPSKVLQFNDFGLVAITRKRVKQSLERTLSTTCGVCQGTGMTKSPITVCNDIYIEMRKMHKHLDRGDVMLRVHPEVVKQLKSGTSKWLQEMEEMVGKTILVKSDPSLHPEQFDIH